ncbi:unnamed protein product [Rotaria magnacalcarata]|uniref:Pentapeptide repeat-containing protein n=1 Tax=Rotaria magnacalcarata TaxID=392030 RepID=A0A819J7K8_9BILA|nr:unnamed protein product [Rotaria magnacalcarata]
MFGRCFYRFWYSNSIYEDNCKRKSRLSKFQLIKIITSSAFSPPVAIFTLVTTLQNRHIAQRNREQDLIETKDDQRQRFFVNYINDISGFRDTNIEHLTHNYNKLLYMRTKTLTTLRKLDNELGANFNGIELNQNDCIFKNVTFSGVYFQKVSFRNCLFENVIFRQVDFRGAILTNSIFYLTYFISCEMDSVNFQQAVISEPDFNGSSLSYTNFQQVKIDFVRFYNVDLTKASFSDSSSQM